MPIHRGPGLTDLIARLPGVIPIQANLIQCWPNLANGTSLTGGNPGAWTQLLAAASAPTVPFICSLMVMTSTGWNSDDEIAVGGSGAEVAHGWIGIYAAKNGNGWPLPLYVFPGGSRVSARSWSSTTDVMKLITMRIPQTNDGLRNLRSVRKLQYGGFYPGHPSGQNVFTISVTAATASAWANTSAWSQMIASTANNMLIYHIGMSAHQNSSGQIDFGFGASGSEIIFASLPYQVAMANGQQVCWDLPAPIFIPSGTRIAVRHTTDDGSAWNGYNNHISGINAGNDL